MTRLLVAIAVMLDAGTAASLRSALQNSEGSLIAVGDHRLYLSCSGSGPGPTIVLEAGGGGTSGDWSLVRQQLGPDIRTCAYDRAGSGKSERGPAPRTLRQEAFELHALLHAAGEKPPYVLTGQSIGGLIVRLYASAHPNTVAGVVLVDATHESGVLGSVRYGGMVRLREKAAGVTLPEPRLSSAGAAHQDTSADYLAEELQQIYLARQRVPQPLGERPLFVLAAGRRPPPPPGIAQDEWTRLRDERDMQVQDLIGLSGNARFLRDPASGHNMHRDNPALVAQAIRDVRDAAMRGSRLAGPTSKH